MKLLIDIPEEDIPKVQGTMEIHLCFCDGKLCQCDYPFDTEIESKELREKNVSKSFEDFVIKVLREQKMK